MNDHKDTLPPSEAPPINEALRMAPPQVKVACAAIIAAEIPSHKSLA